MILKEIYEMIVVKKEKNEKCTTANFYTINSAEGSKVLTLEIWVDEFERNE